MTTAWKAATGLGALALLAGGAGLWGKFGGLVYLDIMAAALAGCFL